MKKIVFLTGTRADFGKLKSLISITQKSSNFEAFIFATGMHLNSKYGKTIDEVYKSGFSNIYPYINHDTIDNMDRTLAKTIDGFSHYIAEIKPDIIVVHGDRSEALAGAIVGSLNNILVAHIEGGEISGTIDELIRHAVSKMSHIHFVANDEAKRRLIQLGECNNSIFTIGSPDLDVMKKDSLPELKDVKKYYDINYEKYAIAMFHPVTTEYDDIIIHVRNFVDALISSERNYIVIYPNNDLGSAEILQEYKRLENLDSFKVFPSTRFEYFLCLLKYAEFIIGNSSAGIREAPFYGLPTIDIGSRQNNRVKLDSIHSCGNDKADILNSILIAQKTPTNVDSDMTFGDGDSDEQFLNVLQTDLMWSINKQKQFKEI
jgi:UDP-N-acetylglucosamine 2-epimerase (hydrolysing)